MTPRERYFRNRNREPRTERGKPRTGNRKRPMILQEEQKALLALLHGAGIEGITLEGLLLAIRDAGFDLTFDAVRHGVLKFVARGFIEFRRGRYFLTAAGKATLNLEP